MKKLKVSVISFLAVLCVFMFSAMFYMFFVGHAEEPAQDNSIEKFIEQNFTLNNATIESKTLPDYFEENNINYQGTDYAYNELKGLRIKPSADVTKCSVTFNIPIDLSRYDGTQTLISFLSTPLTPNRTIARSWEYRYIRLKLTDKYNENVYITLVGSPHYDSNQSTVFRSGSNTQEELGLTNVGAGNLNNFYGTNTKHSMTASGHGTGGTNIFAMDATFKYNVVENGENVFGFNVSNRAVEALNYVRNLSALDQIGPTESLFQGFTTGEVYLTIELDTINNSATEGLTVFQINGMSFLGDEVEDIQAPQVIYNDTVDLNNLPQGEVGKPYRIFNVNAFDNLDGSIAGEKIVKRVYNKADSTTDIPLDEGAFTPDVAGTYVIEYTVEDTSKNKSVKKYEISVGKALKPLSFTFDEEIQSTGLEAGDVLSIPSYTVEGGAGGYTTELKLVSVTGKIVPIELSKAKFTASGDYQLIAKTTDYLGNETITVVDLAVAAIANPIVTEKPIQAYAIAGQKITFPQVEAYDYASYGEETLIGGKITVTLNSDEPVVLDADNSFVPDEPGNLKVVYSASNIIDGKTTEKEYNVKISEAKNISDFLQPKNADDCAIASPNIMQTKYSFTSDNTLTFARKVLANDLLFRYQLDAKNSTLSSIKFEFQDTENVNQKVTLEFRKHSATTTLAILNGKQTLEFNSKMFDTTETIDLKLNNMVIYNGSAKLFDVTEALNGEAMTEFSSGNIFFNVSVVGVQENASIIVHYVNNQYISSKVNADQRGPSISLAGNVSEYIEHGTIVNLPAVNAYDVLGEVETLSASIKYPSGKTVDIEGFMDGYSFLPSESGKYEVMYTGIDDAGNSASIKVTFNVSYLPTVYQLKPIPSAMKVGSTWTIEVPEVASDAQLSIYVKDANYRTIKITEDEQGKYKYTFETAGIYFIKYVTKHTGLYDYSVQEYRIEIR